MLLQCCSTFNFGRYSMPRILTAEFENSFLEGGVLSKILKEVHCDNTLDFQIRSNVVHIYYRGGKILDIRPSSNASKFTICFDDSHFSSDTIFDLPLDKVRNIDNAGEWIDAIPKLKRAIDHHNANIGRRCEREYQLTFSRENTYSAISNNTDYFIVDIEYQTPLLDTSKGHSTKFDMVGIHWPAKSSARRSAGTQRPQLSLFEVKYGDNALKGKITDSGLIGHFSKTLDFVKQNGSLDSIKNEVVDLFKQKRRLGLVKFGTNTPGDIEELDAVNSQFVVLLANHNPRSKAFDNVINDKDFIDLHTELSRYMDIRFATASFMGYGLYESHMLTLHRFINYIEYLKLHSLIKMA